MPEEPLVSEARTIELSSSGAKTVRRVSSEPAVQVSDRPFLPLAFSERYAPEQTLGEGGMGIVKLLHDRQIGRHVAVKVMREGGATPKLAFCGKRACKVSSSIPPWCRFTIWASIPTAAASSR